MLLVPTAEPIPLVADANGVIRVGRTRVTLDTVITAFLEGATAEEIREQYPSLQLSDIYIEADDPTVLEWAAQVRFLPLR